MQPSCQIFYNTFSVVDCLCGLLKYVIYYFQVLESELELDTFLNTLLSSLF